MVMARCLVMAMVLAVVMGSGILRGFGDVTGAVEVDHENPQSSLHAYWSIREKMNHNKHERHKEHSKVSEVYHKTNDRTALKEWHTRRRNAAHLVELTAESFDDRIKDGYWVIQFHTGEVVDVVDKNGGGGAFQKAAEEFDSMVKFGTLNARQFARVNHRYHNRGEGKYPVFRVFGNGTYLCHFHRHRHTVDWVTNVLDIVRWEGCEKPPPLQVPENDSPAHDQTLQRKVDPQKWLEKHTAARQRRGEDLNAMSDEL
eukprot:TRINITY_DN8700_c0_g1_i16.p1 TRINITY_DN8700_c0_g1~~TRINITY_DN8700_c0_g1_i16.p1  ORF type:complete len:257 (-),score=63.04 TRINITY_DN8700_c0_g1_i16:402-1172(-)